MSNLITFTIKRFAAMIVVIFLITTIVFFLAHLSPFDPIRLRLGQKFLQEPALYHHYQVVFGLTGSLWQQYINYLGSLIHGNLGYSEETTTFGVPVWSILKVGVPVSLRLGGYSLALALIVGLPVGLISALRQNSIIDHVFQLLMMVAWAVPAFVLAPIAQLVFGVNLGILPVSGWGDPGVLGLQEMVLPVIIFAAGLSGYFAKSFRSFLLEVLQQDYIRTARAKGLKQRTVIYLHAIKNTLLPLATIVGPTIAFLIVGAFLIEFFFDIPGIGDITVNATVQSDYPVIEATTILLAVAVVVVNFLTDVFYALVDPRIRI